MKLRNKKTGEIVEAESCNSTTGMIGIYYEDKNGQVGTKDCFETLAELNEEWEDYKPIVPFIKDEKIRKAVKVWAEANHVKCARIVGVGTLRCERTGIDIEFDGAPFVGWVTELKTIAELCGEEEE